MPPQRRTKRKRSDEGTSRAPSPEAAPEIPRAPSGLPFIDKEIEWKYMRIDLADKPNKTMLTGYETMAGDVRTVLSSLPIRVVHDVAKSAIAAYTHLPDYSTRSGKMIHYVIFREVEPVPYFDKTALWFNIGRAIIRFSRIEYALVSGLRFGPAEFNPYDQHTLPPGSVFERLFGANTETTLSNVRTTFLDKHFEVDDAQIIPTIDDYIKLAKLLLTLNHALGFDQYKKKIPLWIWVLFEDTKKWEEFPWGSYSYQLLFHSIRNVVRMARETKTGKICYHLKGNTIAFSAWIYEAFPAFGRVVGAKKVERARPRFLRYKYMKERGYPTEAEINLEIMPQLKPHKKEIKTNYWLTMENDPEGMPFELQYNANDGKTKPRVANVEEQADEYVDITATTTGASLLTAADVKHIAAKAAEAAVADMKELVDTLLKQNNANFVKAVADEVITRLLKQSRNDDSHHMDVQTTGRPSMVTAAHEDATATPVGVAQKAAVEESASAAAATKEEGPMAAGVQVTTEQEKTMATEEAEPTKAIEGEEATPKTATDACTTPGGEQV